MNTIYTLGTRLYRIRRYNEQWISVLDGNFVDNDSQFNFKSLWAGRAHNLFLLKTDIKNNSLGFWLTEWSQSFGWYVYDWIYRYYYIGETKLWIHSLTRIMLGYGPVAMVILKQWHCWGFSAWYCCQFMYETFTSQLSISGWWKASWCAEVRSVVVSSVVVLWTSVAN